MRYGRAITLHDGDDLMPSDGVFRDEIGYYRHARLLDSSDELVTSLSNAVKLEVIYWDGTHIMLDLWDTG